MTSGSSSLLPSSREIPTAASVPMTPATVTLIGPVGPDTCARRCTSKESGQKARNDRSVQPVNRSARTQCCVPKRKG
eukprot:CAMPEP_0175952264 /NCGR_PEP_ID=MMETSP0108-20121206/30651_1 /TAXON_ID=195067 ORGANISM="Goniomonas pacifica, Strain CCMP1869" /NCGR_SAMPLE_ID=MMETSP0108 /ASSEMBLY_ACC=CAM_ASM_000204 /LENGTH=76 /DNA_ID=CAMNT_0017278599 /DNA_START=12 /DNA_END=242 /DNA_ORIENTATION=-